MAANDNVSDQVLEQITAALGESIQRVDRDRGQVTLVTTAADAHRVVQALKSEHGYGFLVDLTAVDYRDWPAPEEYAERFAVVYAFSSFERNDRIRVKALVSELEPEIQSVTDLFGAANWLEREVFDMFGVHFKDHPNLGRILCPDYLKGNALRKEYPLRGRGERDSFPKYSPDQE
jgi:NADH-quinone oxidoreductase subunit C